MSLALILRFHYFDLCNFRLQSGQIEHLINIVLCIWVFLQYKRYRSYTNILRSSKLQPQLRDKTSKPTATDAFMKRNGFLGGENIRRYSSLNDLLDATDGDQKVNYRESYFMAIYKG